MVTITQVLQFHVAQVSERIRRLKSDAFKSEKAQKWVYVSPDGAVFRCRRKCAFDPDARWTQRWEAYEKVTACISPPHPSWPEYLAAREEASRWLTALHLLKFGNGALPLKKDVRKAVRAGKFAHHVSRAKASALIFSALASLSSTLIELAADPERFAEAERFTAARREARHGQS